MNDNIYEILDDMLISNYLIEDEGFKKTILLGTDGKYGKMETYSIFPGIILSYLDMKFEHMDDVFSQKNGSLRFLEINHCLDGRYSYQFDEDELIYFGKGDLCISIPHSNKIVSNFPLGYYRGLEILIDIEMANREIKKYLPNFDLIDFYNCLNKKKSYVLIRSNNKINHVIGELYSVDDRIKLEYFRLKCVELLLFFSITQFKHEDKLSLSQKQVDIIEKVKYDLTQNLESKLTIDELSDRYGISKTSLKNCFKEVYGKPIYKWRKEYKLDYACKLMDSGEFNISEISKMVGYSSPSKFTHAFKNYMGCTPSEYKN